MERSCTVNEGSCGARRQELHFLDCQGSCGVLKSLNLILYFQGLEKVLNLDKLVLEVLKSLKFCRKVVFVSHSQNSADSMNDSMSKLVSK